MRVLYFKPGVIRPMIYRIDGDLASMQQTVGGYIETVPLGDGLVLVCDEEARLKGSPPNRVIDGIVICGAFFICRQGRDGDLTDLTLTDAQDIRDTDYRRWMAAQYAVI